MVKLEPSDERVSRGDGFALVGSLAWMGFVLLLLLSLSAVIRVESVACGASLRTLELRQAVRLALGLALGQLQAAAGPDQRVTAPAGTPGWCGVWDTAVPDGEPLLLVPGSGGPDRWRLSPPAWPEEEGVEVPVLEIPWGRGGGRARIAWWTSDEGSKASLGKSGSFDPLPEAPGLRQDAAEVLEACTPLRYRCDVSGGSEPFQSGSRGLPGVVPPVAAGLLEEVPASLTWSSLGLLCDVVEGGLRADLSHPATDADVLMGDTEAVRALLSRWPEDGHLHRLTGHPEGSLADGLPGLASPLLMHEFGLYLGVFRENIGPQTRLKAHLTVRAEIWNPHAVPLAMTGRGETDLRLVVRGLPALEAAWTTGAGSGVEVDGRFVFEPGTLEARADRDGAPLGRLGEEGFPVDIFDDFTSADTRLKAVRGHASLGVTVPDGTPGGDDRIELSAPPAELAVELLTADGVLLQRFSGVRFEGFASASVRPQELLPVYASRSPAYADYQALYHFRLLDGVHRVNEEALAPMELWFSRWDPRTPVFELSGEGDLLLRSLVEVDTDPARNLVLQSNFFPGDPEFLNGGNFIRAFDLPLAPVVSLGWLQHLQFHGRRPFSVGNPWGGPLNQVFDRFYLSGFPFAAAEAGMPGSGGLNPHLVRLAGPDAPGGVLAATVQAEEPARQLLVDGAFNINSTSAGAWRCLLGSLQLDGWRFREGYGGSGIERPHLRNGAFRFPQGGRHHYKSPYLAYATYPEVSQADKARWYKWQPGEPDWLYAYDMGLRELREQDLDALADAVVERLQERQRPFFSLAGFVNSGLLQEAIDQTEINAVAAGAYVAHSRAGDAPVFPRYGPSFLTQADLLSTFAPLLSARSDTFVIRARAEVLPAGGTGPVTAGGCEALVQRMPDLLDPDKPEKGRRFRILSIRWLNGEGA